MFGIPAWLTHLPVSNHSYRFLLEQLSAPFHTRRIRVSGRCNPYDMLWNSAWWKIDSPVVPRSMAHHGGDVNAMTAQATLAREISHIEEQIAHARVSFPHHLLCLQINDPTISTYNQYRSVL